MTDESKIFYKNKEILFDPNLKSDNLENSQNCIINMENSDAQDGVKRVNPPSKSQISLFMSLTIITICIQNFDFSPSNTLLENESDLKVMTNDDHCFEGSSCLSFYQIFWFGKHFLLICYFIFCFFFFRKYF